MSGKVIYAIVKKEDGQGVRFMQVPSQLSVSNLHGVLAGREEEVNSSNNNDNHFRKRKMPPESRRFDLGGSEVVVVESQNSLCSSDMGFSSSGVLFDEQNEDSMYYDSMDMDHEYDLDEDGNIVPRQRKRAKLHHLSNDEKMNRRKVMNRIAAQQARDRKKLRMEKMESSLHRLEVENKYLRCENKDLKTKLDSLSSRFNQLLLRLDSKSSVSALGSVEPLRPAVPDSQQKGCYGVRALMTLAVVLSLCAPERLTGLLKKLNVVCRVNSARREKCARWLKTCQKVQQKRCLVNFPKTYPSLMTWTRCSGQRTIS